MRSRQASLLPAILAAAALAGCGSSSSTTGTPTASTSTPSQSTPAPPAPGLAAAEHPSASAFPAARGRTLRQVAAVAHMQAQLGLATGTFTPGVGRVAFAITDSSGAFVYAPTALYVATRPDAPAQGPFLAPADPVTVPARFQSAQNAGPGGIQAIYDTDVPLGKPTTYSLLALSRAPNGSYTGATGELAVAKSSPIPAVGQAPPAIATDTTGPTALLTTRTPPESMHSVSFKDALGRQPVALLFSTPQLCQSRVCGPVTDIAVMLQQQFGSRVAFIHQEVYVGNQPNKGLRPQMQAFHLQTEPWLFVVDRHGRIAARLEGAFGVNEFTQALQAGLR